MEFFHQQQPNFSITCGINGCITKFVRVESWRKHMFRKHRLTQAALKESEVRDLNSDCDSEIELQGNPPDVINDKLVSLFCPCLTS
jgi:coenzyme F420-reducing hydrogenase gamma subunit